MIVQPLVLGKYLIQMFAAMEMRGANNIGNAPIEPLHHAIGLRVLWIDQSMLNAMHGANFFERMLACWPTLPIGNKAVGKLFSVVCQYGTNPHR